MKTPTELLRFAAVGVLSNAVLYVLYLALTATWLGQKSAVTLLYCVGGVQGFLLNSRWTFQHFGGLRTAMGRYWTVYLLGYFVNLGLLILLVDFVGLPHREVQAGLVVLIAALSFLLHRSWVFRPDPAAPRLPL